MSEEDERYEKKVGNSPIIKINNYTGKKGKNITHDKINQISKKEISSNNELKIDKIHYSKKISLDIINSISKSIGTINVSTNNGKSIGTCFFMYIMNKKFVITNSHVIPVSIIKAKKRIKLINNAGSEFTICLDSIKRIITNLNKPIDILAVEILEQDKINDIIYLDYDIDNMNNLENYDGKEIFIEQHPKNMEVYLSFGIINNIEKINNEIIEFEHTLDTDYGSSGSPIFLYENPKVVIGIHKKRIKKSDNKKGTFISILIKKIMKKQNKISNLINLNKINEINDINNTNEINNKDVNEIQKNNLIILKYKLDDNNKDILLFSDSYIKYKKLFIAYINGKKYELTSNRIKKDEFKISQNQIEIRVVISLNNMEEMFFECHSLISVNFINMDISEVKSLYRLFADCKNLTEIKGIDTFNTSNIEDLAYLFSGCTSLKYLPKTLNWDTRKVVRMNKLFSDCKSLIEIPDISKWNTGNVQNMSSLFENCESLTNIPKKNFWNTKNVKNMSHMFHNCEKLEELPNISCWNTSNVESLSNMFSYCKSLKTIPNISKWNTENVKTMNNLFLHCESVTHFPDISRWNTKKVENMNCMFDFCINAKYFPDITKLITKRAKNKRLIKKNQSKYDIEDE